MPNYVALKILSIQIAQQSSPAYSDAYRDNRSFSQIIGWILLGVTATLGLCMYAVSRCCHPLTYYHAKYYDLYRMHEENEFDDEMNKKVSNIATYRAIMIINYHYR